MIAESDLAVRWPKLARAEGHRPRFPSTWEAGSGNTTYVSVRKMKAAGMKNSEIAARLGVSQSHVSQILRSKP